jgi:molecular chaperone GrpE
MEPKGRTNKPTQDNQRAASAPGAEPAVQPEPLVRNEPPPLTPEEIEDLKSRAAKADEHWNRLLRTAADFENFKKRAARERHDAVKFANEALIQKLLPVLDHFDMALAATKNSQANAVQSLQAGIVMVHQQLKGVLAEAGLEEVDASGRHFDPKMHEAVSQQETADVPEGQVVQQLRKGYRLRGRLLRPAAVVVAKKPIAQEPGATPAGSAG